MKQFRLSPRRRAPFPVTFRPSKFCSPWMLRGDIHLRGFVSLPSSTSLTWMAQGSAEHFWQSPECDNDIKSMDGPRQWSPCSLSKHIMPPSSFLPFAVNALFMLQPLLYADISQFVLNVFVGVFSSAEKKNYQNDCFANSPLKNGWDLSRYFRQSSEFPFWARNPHNYMTVASHSTGSDIVCFPGGFLSMH